MRLSKLLLAALIALTCPRNATGQAGRADPAGGWTDTYKPNINYPGITRAERAFAIARLAELERVFRRIPELMTPTEFVVRRQYFGGSRPLMIPNGAVEYSLFIWFFGRFGPAREVAREGCTCIAVTINAGPGSDRSDEHGRPIFMEGDPGEPIPGATVVYAGAPSDVREVSGSVVFTRAGVFPWETLSREEYLRALIHEAEGLNGEKIAPFRKALEQTAYEHWIAAAPQRKKDRDRLAAALRGNRTPEEVAHRIAAMEATEREVTEQLKAQHATDQKTNQEVLARPTYGDQLRAQIEAMSPEERRRPALVRKDGQLLPPDAPKGNRMLRPKLEFWRVRQSPVEIHSITVSISGSTGTGQVWDAVISAIQQTYRNLDWAALKRMVDAAP